MLTACLAVCTARGSEAPMPPKVYLTLGVAANAEFGQGVQVQLAALQQRLAGRLCHPLSLPGPAKRPHFCEGEDERAVVHVVVLKNGAIWRLASTHPAYLEQPAQIGSLAKALVAVPILARAGARTEEQWCVQAVAGIRNADGFGGHDQCSERGAMIDATFAMARSNNLATIWRLRQLSAGHVQRELDTAGIVAAPGRFHPGLAVALGMLEVTPRQALECFDGLARGQARRANITQNSQGAPTQMASWCAGATATPQGRAVVDGLLRAPASAGGTASFLPAMLPAAAQWRAKTGTPTDAAARATGKLLLFSLRHGGHLYTALLSVASPKPSWPLAEHLASSDLAGLVNVAVRAIAADGER